MEESVCQKVGVSVVETLVKNLFVEKFLHTTQVPCSLAGSVSSVTAVSPRFNYDSHEPFSCAFTIPISIED